ncbi:hypothetical protein PHYSODRAFT_295295 [Phytophthora sojae]|uniref:Uncharacterized protein n=1 Tax=Phytophthora sojae (strain P6497) TaxID=1094619 RepID=G4YLP3_PHYSP|nr:hypothetical protein PHYSODRAFT_295295 [Phytophthora sojae]EGZ30524.1 hypothetical protein PHYSODRAFT_295295 [Phytophthora sojae]|eukprot:XP_009517799.1 hypothetical protein PHYSODRAFT_295295 [Phytophthora sojae]
MPAAPSIALQQERAVINSAELALEGALCQASNAFDVGADAAQRVYEATIPLLREVEAISERMGHYEFNYRVDIATYSQSTTLVDALQPALDKTEAALREANERLLRLTALTQSGSWACDCERSRMGTIVVTARATINALWDLTKERQANISIIQATLTSAGGNGGAPFITLVVSRSTYVRVDYLSKLLDRVVWTHLYNFKPARDWPNKIDNIIEANSSEPPLVNPKAQQEK